MTCTDNTSICPFRAASYSYMYYGWTKLHNQITNSTFAMYHAPT